MPCLNARRDSVRPNDKFRLLLRARGYLFRQCRELEFPATPRVCLLRSYGLISFCLLLNVFALSGAACFCGEDEGLCNMQPRASTAFPSVTPLTLSRCSFGSARGVPNLQSREYLQAWYSSSHQSNARLLRTIPLPVRRKIHELGFHPNHALWRRRSRLSLDKRELVCSLPSWLHGSTLKCISAMYN